MKKNFIDNTIIFTEQNAYTCKQNVLEEPNNNINEIPEVKNIFKNIDPLTLEPSQPSRIHTIHRE